LEINRIWDLQGTWTLGTLNHKEKPNQKEKKNFGTTQTKTGGNTKPWAGQTNFRANEAGASEKNWGEAIILKGGPFLNRGQRENPG